MVYTGLTDQEGANQVARKLFETYDRDMLILFNLGVEILII